MSDSRRRSVISIVHDFSKATQKRFTEEHVDKSVHLRSDGWNGIREELRGG